jgi:putative SOS response-associated peptidase YedK
MCNDFGNNIPYSDYLAAFSQTRIPVKWPNAAPNLEPRDDIWPTERAPVIRRLQDGTNEFSELRWGFPSARLDREGSVRPIGGGASDDPTGVLVAAGPPF